MQQFLKQQELFTESMAIIDFIWTQIREEWLNHIKAIESMRNKKIYNKDVQFVDEVITNQGREKYAQFINNMKKVIFGKKV